LRILYVGAALLSLAAEAAFADVRMRLVS